MNDAGEPGSSAASQSATCNPSPPSALHEPSRGFPAHGAESAISRPRVLFVDDEENILKSLRRLFRAEPWHMEFVTSGAEALERLEAGPFDMIVTDQRMPGMTGVELLKTVRRRWPASVRIVLSGYADVQSILDAVNEGSIFKFLTKPWDDGVLRQSLAEAAEAVHLRRINERLQAIIDDQNEDLYRTGRSIALSGPILAALPVAVVAVGEDGAIALANAQACRALGAASQEELLGRRLDLPASLSRAGLAVRTCDRVETPGWSGRVYAAWEG